ncbi:MAG: glutamate--tRNA ligase [Desulfurococcales archaeon]|nr:glutamate--tRNA ligase [Desulfurococcales archaeon]
MELEDLVRGYALKNAVKHGGKARVGSVVSMILGEHPELRQHAREIAAIASRIVEEVNRMSLGEQRRILEERYPSLLEEKGEREERPRLPPLPGAVEGRVRTRFAPNPDFVIHIGNARPAILSDEYAKMYKGVLVLRFEDTDPRTKTPLREAYDLIKEDLKWLGVSWGEEYIQSLRLEIYYDVARKLIERGCAYIDTCGEEGRDLIRKGVGCPTRNNPVEWHLEELDKMLSGHYGEGEAVLRVKTRLDHPNPSVRDWVGLRIIDTVKHPHPITGSRYNVWPTYNLAVSIDDHMMGITHVLRAKEHEVNTEKQLYVYKCMEWDPPVFIHFGRLKLEGFIMSKSHIRRLLEENPDKFMGYDDPRFGTIAGLRRRGILPEAIRESIIMLGVKPGDVTLSWANLAAVNRKILDKMADRIMYVGDWVELRVDQEECMTATIPRHPERPGEARSIRVCPGDVILLNKSDARGEVRLMGLGNYRVDDGRLVYIGGGLEYARGRRLPIIQWVRKEEAVKTRILRPEGLDLVVEEGYSEAALRDYGVDSRIQLIRYGFARVDSTGAVYTLVYTHS